MKLFEIINESSDDHYSNEWLDQHTSTADVTDAGIKILNRKEFKKNTPYHLEKDSKIVVDNLKSSDDIFNALDKQPEKKRFSLFRKDVGKHIGQIWKQNGKYYLRYQYYGATSTKQLIRK